MTLNQTDLGPVNINYGQSALFTAEFFDDDNITTIPSGATFVITYINLDGAEQSDSISMLLNNDFYNCIWSSTSAALGLALWTVASAGHSSAAQLGIIRVISEDV